MSRVGMHAVVLVLVVIVVSMQKKTALSTISIENVSDISAPSLQKQHDGSHSLSMRHSSLSRDWHKYLGPPINRIPSTHLPTRRVILQRYSYIRSSDTIQSTSDTVKLIAEEVLNVWESSGIPVKCLKTITTQIKRCVDK